jgi:hypothetical protein
MVHLPWQESCRCLCAFFRAPLHWRSEVLINAEGFGLTGTVKIVKVERTKERQKFDLEADVVTTVSATQTARKPQGSDIWYLHFIHKLIQSPNSNSSSALSNRTQRSIPLLIVCDSILSHRTTTIHLDDDYHEGILWWEVGLVDRT